MAISISDIQDRYITTGIYGSDGSVVVQFVFQDVYGGVSGADIARAIEAVIQSKHSGATVSSQHAHSTGDTI
jgi:hypothetical protein